MSRSVTVGEQLFPTVTRAKQAVKDIWNDYEVGSAVTKQEDHDFLFELVLMYRDPPAKIGPGVDHFKVVDPGGGGQRRRHGRAISIVRVDGTEEEFSALKVLDQPEVPFALLCAALSNEAQEITGRVRESRFETGSVTCPTTGIVMTEITDAEARRTDPPLSILVAEFLRHEGLTVDAIEIANLQAPEVRSPEWSISGPILVDPVIREKWLQYQNDHIDGLTVVHRSAPRKRRLRSG